MGKIFSSVSCNLDDNILSACLPLFEGEKIEAIEWSFDTLYSVKNIPAWFIELLDAFSKEGRLIGHGVYFSLFSGRWTNEQEAWLAELKKTCSTFRFDHISEHFGFMTGENFHQGAPIGIPYTESTLALGRDRLKRISHSCLCPVGLENLAFSYSLDEVKRHGEFLDRLLSPINGFIILDLHNLYCQCHNFTVSFDDLVQLYPLHRVREIHISGGSWEDSAITPAKKVRRDTHNDAVPEEVFRFLECIISACPQLKFIVLEQLGNGLEKEDMRLSFRKDFLQMEAIVREANNRNLLSATNNFLPEALEVSPIPIEDNFLYGQQTVLSHILETAIDYADAKRLLRNSILANTSWNIEAW
ncbi:MAG TPA: DUF692 family protein, partial [Flavisolibacter sp.]|nr:DUF692 family protein [Flavisolibacter sp.]